MSIYITIDGGTTNTRVNLVKDGQVIECIKLGVGARVGIENGNLLRTEIKTAIEKLLSDNSLAEKDIVRILASGMLTSEFGLCKLDHIKTPAGIDELHSLMEEKLLSDISNIPFTFIRGVMKNADNFEDCDIMRGEETELMGIINPDYGQCLYILPGSHSKIILTVEKGSIVDFSTMLTGEMIAALSQNTILKDAVDLTVSDIEDKYLLMGYDYCKKEGINKSLFKVRILKNIFNCTKVETYSFFVGTVLCNEIERIINQKAESVVIGGKTQIRNAIVLILRERDTKKVITLDDNAVNLSTVHGAINIFESK